MKTNETIGNIHVVQNQYALNRAGLRRIRRHKARYNELRKSGYGTRLAREDKIVPTSKKPEGTVAAVDKRFQSGDIIALLTGDGGFKDFTEARARYGSEALQAARILLLDCGFANDGAYQFNSKGSLKRPSTILDWGRTASFLPMKWLMTSPVGVDIQYANLYGTTGVSAAVALEVSEEKNRQWAGDSFPRKVWVTQQAAKKFGLFDIVIEGEEKHLYDFGLSNGSSMAGQTNAFPIELGSLEYYQYELDKKAPIRDGLRLKFGAIKGETVVPPRSIFLPGGGLIQLDGEAMIKPADTEITVEPAEHVVTVFSEYKDFDLVA